MATKIVAALANNDRHPALNELAQRYLTEIQKDTNTVGVMWDLGEELRVMRNEYDDKDNVPFLAACNLEALCEIHGAFFMSIPNFQALNELRVHKKL